jgi:hypothetical protein
VTAQFLFSQILGPHVGGATDQPYVDRQLLSCPRGQARWAQTIYIESAWSGATLENFGVSTDSQRLGVME